MHLKISTFISVSDSDWVDVDFDEDEERVSRGGGGRGGGRGGRRGSTLPGSSTPLKPTASSSLMDSPKPSRMLTVTLTCSQISPL